MKAYQRRMRRYNLEIILSALIALVILIAFFLIAWVIYYFFQSGNSTSVPCSRR